MAKRVSTAHPEGEKFIVIIRGVTSGIRASKMAGERLKERMARLETLLGVWPEDEDTMTAFADSMKNEFEV